MFIVFLLVPVRIPTLSYLFYFFFICLLVHSRIDEFFGIDGHLANSHPVLFRNHGSSCNNFRGRRFPRREANIPLIYPMQIHTLSIKIWANKKIDIQDLHQSASHHASLGNASLYSKYIYIHIKYLYKHIYIYIYVFTHSYKVGPYHLQPDLPL